MFVQLKAAIAKISERAVNNMKHAKVTLVNCTPDPEKTIYAAWQIMHTGPIITSEVMVEYPEEGMEPFFKNGPSIRDFLKAVGNQVHQGVLEMVHFNLLIENVSRAFQQQLTRTRQASYCIQSLRVVRCDNFADEGSFLPFQGAREKGDYYYEQAMMAAQSAYRNMIASGASAEDARGVLPMAIFSPIWMSINLRALIHMLDQRFCTFTQGEFKKVAEAIREAIREKHPMLAEAFLDRCGCERTNFCSSSVPCGKYPKLGNTKKFKITTDKNGKTTTCWE